MKEKIWQWWCISCPVMFTGILVWEIILYRLKNLCHCENSMYPCLSPFSWNPSLSVLYHNLEGACHHYFVFIVVIVYLSLIIRVLWSMLTPLCTLFLSSYSALAIFHSPETYGYLLLKRANPSPPFAFSLCFCYYVLFSKLCFLLVFLPLPLVLQNHFWQKMHVRIWPALSGHG